MSNGNDSDTAVMEAPEGEETQAQETPSDQAPARSPEAAVSSTPWSEASPLVGFPQSSGLGRLSGAALPPLAAAAPPAPPAGAQIHARHGGFLTGLAGVLLDGLAAGLSTPQSGEGFSQAAAKAMDMPRQRQQQALEMQKAQTDEQLNQAKLLHAHVQQVQDYALLNRMDEEQTSGITDEVMKQNEELKNQNLFDPIATAPTRAAVASRLHDLRSTEGNSAIHYWAEPTGKDTQGNINEWTIFRGDPNKALTKDMSVNVPDHLDDQGNVVFKSQPIPAGTKYTDAVTLRSSLMSEGIHRVGLQREQQLGLGKGAAPTAAGLEDRAFQERQQRDTAQGKTPPTREEFHQEWAGKADKAAEKVGVAVRPDGSNEVMNEADAKRQKLTFFPLKGNDTTPIRNFVYGMNDLQTAVNNLSKVNMKNVQPAYAGALLDRERPDLQLGKAIELKLPASARLGAWVRGFDINQANQDTRNYVSATLAAHEALTQLPRLQTFGTSSRVTQEQMRAAQGMLPQPGDDEAFKRQQLHSIQNILDPLKKGSPKLEGAVLTPSFRDQAGAQGAAGDTIQVRSGGRVQTIYRQNLDKARARDPQLQVVQ